jgi:hypothetical protein
LTQESVIDPLQCATITKICVAAANAKSYRGDSVVLSVRTTGQATVVAPAITIVGSGAVKVTQVTSNLFLLIAGQPTRRKHDQGKSDVAPAVVNGVVLVEANDNDSYVHALNARNRTSICSDHRFAKALSSLTVAS